jgi:hypothetical protein
LQVYRSKISRANQVPIVIQLSAVSDQQLLIPPFSKQTGDSQKKKASLAASLFDTRPSIIDILDHNSQ